MRRRIFADVRDYARHAPPVQRVADALLGIGENEHALAGGLELLHEGEKLRRLLVGLCKTSAPTLQQLHRARPGLRRHFEREARLAIVADVNRELLRHPRAREFGRGVFLPRPRDHAQDVLAGAERVLAEIRARAERLAARQPAQRDAVGLARERAVHEVIAPRAACIRTRHDGHFFLARPLLALGERAAFERGFIEQFQRQLLLLRRRCGEAERGLFLQHKGEHQCHPFRGTVAFTAMPPHAIPPRRIACERDDDRLASRRVQQHLESRIVRPRGIRGIDVERGLSRLAEQPFPLGPEPSFGLLDREPREPIVEGELRG